MRHQQLLEHFNALKMRGLNYGITASSVAMTGLETDLAR
jgi:hypothetical protein